MKDFRAIASILGKRIARKENGTCTGKTLKEMIELHANLIHFLSVVIIIVIELRALEGLFNNLNIEFVACFYATLIQISFVYVLCSLGSNVSYNYNKMSNVLYNTDWYLLPLNQHKSIIPIIRQNQIHFSLDGFNMFDCSLETFTKVSIPLSNLD